MSSPLTTSEQNLLDYLPYIVVNDLANDAYNSAPPIIHNLATVALFGDVSGFTALSERLAQDEVSEGRGSEKLAFYLNAYFAQVAKFITDAGGDIFKFAGDALLVLWPDDNGDDVSVRVQSAVQAGVTIQENLHNASLGLPGDDDVRLSIKIGIGVGVVSVAHLGGMKDLYGQHQFEAICVGSPLVQAFGSEHHAVSGDVVVSRRVWEIVQDTCEGVEIKAAVAAGGGGGGGDGGEQEERDGDYVKVLKMKKTKRVRTRPLKRTSIVESIMSKQVKMEKDGGDARRNARSRLSSRWAAEEETNLTAATSDDGQDVQGGEEKSDDKSDKSDKKQSEKHRGEKFTTVLRRARRYVPRAVQPFLSFSHEFFGSEMRRVSVLFVNLGFVDQELALMLDENFAIRLNRAFRCVQDAVYMYDGTINKFLVDDKGSTLIACFGLPPSSHENDAPRSVLAGMALASSLLLDGLHASVGVTNGLVFCGVVGNQGGRREYTVLGDTVNLSARLMQHAMVSFGLVWFGFGFAFFFIHFISYFLFSFFFVVSCTFYLLTCRHIKKQSCVMELQSTCREHGLIFFEWVKSK